MALVPVGSPARSPGRLDQGLPTEPSLPESLEPLRHQPICSGSIRLREYVLVLETVVGLSNWQDVGRNAESMVDPERLSTDTQTD